MKILQKFVLLVFGVCAYLNLNAQEIPLVYDVENTGTECPLPPLPDFEDLPVVNPLTDPFEWSNGSGRDTTFASWACRRAEIKAEIENYEIGIKPDRPDSIVANYSDGLLTIDITVNGNTLTLTSQIILPEGDGPFPAVIGMGGGSGSLPSDIFSSRNVAQVSFNYWEVMAHTQNRGNEPINALYPELIYMGAYSAWPWGVSRLIDGLELVADDLPIDLKHLAVTGCSFAGKMALFAGALDERIALTISQESGGGGAAAWRVSQTLNGVENLGATSNVWFTTSMFRFAGKNVNKLPHDHHELMAMIAPRALLVLGNPDYVWLADESGYVSCKAAQKVWENFGIADRFGYSIVAGHGHCALPASQYPEVEAFVDKFLLSDTTAFTNVEVSPYADVDYNRWIEWWGTGESYFPEQFFGTTLMFETECAILGDDWYKASDSKASNEAYILSKPEPSIIKKTNIDEASQIEIPFTLDTAGTYTVHARVNCESKDHDSFYIKVDDENFTWKSASATNGWEWIKLGEYKLTEGEHTIYMSYRESEGKIDKVCMSSYMFYEPSDFGDPAVNLCDPRVGIEKLDASSDYYLGENFPDPFSATTNINFNIPNDTFVSLKVYNMQGAEICELAGKEFEKGKHKLEFDARNLTKGIYFYRLKTDNYYSSQKMTIN